MKNSLKWQKEYKEKGIPSSFRTKSSGVVEYFWEFLEKHGSTTGRVLDVGCGRGRNSFFFAQKGFQVDAMDFVPELLREIQKVSEKENNQIQTHCQSVTDGWPFPDQVFDVVIDIFCYKHQTDKQKQQFYRKELFRTLKKNGYYLISLAAEDDGFYGPLLKDSPDPEKKMILDPFTGVASYLYTKQDLLEEFGDSLELCEIERKEKEGEMHGEQYMRRTLFAIFQKK